MKPPRKRPRKLTQEKADAINRKRDLIEGHESSYEYQRLRALPGRRRTVLR